VEPAFGGDLGALNKAVFEDRRWDDAMQYIRRAAVLRGPSDAQALLMEGAKCFGIWRQSQNALRALIPHVLEQPKPEQRESEQQESQKHAERLEANGEAEMTEVKSNRGAKSVSISPGLHDWMQAECESQSCLGSASRSLSLFDPLKTNQTASSKWRVVDAYTKTDIDTVPNNSYSYALLDRSTLWWNKRMMFLIVSAVSLCYGYYVVGVKYKGVVDVFGWPVFVARAAGMASIVSTAILYLTMARSFMALLYRLLPHKSPLGTLLDAHKEIHIFFARSLFLFQVLHIFGHAIGTFPGIAMTSPEVLNSLAGCANQGTTLKGWPSLSWLHWPACPFERELTGPEVWFMTMPGLTGILLVLVFLLVGYTGHKVRRAANFDRFWYVHNVAIVLWPILLFLHGSNQWLGMGFPLVVFICGVPISCYSVDRVLRFVRYYLYSGRSVQIVGATVRRGKRGGPEGAMTQLYISKPWGLWDFHPGMYAFICMPEYAPLQWHPFTIASGESDKHVEFIIAGVGDWTQHLAQRCLDACSSGAPFPQVALDGPYPAPAANALSKKVLVAVGAGVGITPFLSLMSTIVGLFEAGGFAGRAQMEEAHLYWLTRSVDEFLFGKKHFTKIVASSSLRQRLHLHLHTTAAEPNGNAAGFLFREAVRRQSAIDRKAFEEYFETQQHIVAPQMPWCWAAGVKQDVLWLSHLTQGAEVPVRREADGWVDGFSSETPAEVAHQSGEADSTTSRDREVLLPVAFGRPDFEVELRAIGAHWPTRNVNVFVCGNPALVKSLKKTCANCNEEAVRRAKVTGTRPQLFEVAYERFG